MRANNLSRYHRLLVELLCLSLCLSSTAMAAEDAFSSLKLNSSVREYYSSNRENRFLIKVHVWGNAAQTGIYYIPDNSTMLDLVSLTGGPSGVFENTVVSLTATQPSKKDRASLVKIEGREIVDRAEMRNFPLQGGDVIYIESPPKTDSFLRTLGVVSSVLGLITTGLSLYLVTK